MASIIQPTNDWVKKLSEVKIDKSDLNKLIMNYFVIEGYKDAAETFSQECGISPSIDVDSINDRMNIKNAIQNGNVEEAIERVNDLNPEASILDTNPKLYFHLQQQRLIEYIRQGRVSEALEFAQDELAPLGEENPEFLEELERSMALLAFDDTTTSPVGDLLHPSQRLRTASELNAAILTSQSQEKDPKLPNLLKMLVWAQDELDEKEIVRVTNNDDDNTASINDTDISEGSTVNIKSAYIYL
ncbi:12338_t:CDS:2 [Entrophospora sp. SA101]|nr:12338_t:CDS:2 [Entrophospora sp. SA101]